VLRSRRYPGGSVYYRAAACTGALYHVDVYFAAGQLDGLDAGIYHFGPHDFALRRLRDGRPSRGAGRGDRRRAAHRPGIRAARPHEHVLAERVEIPDPHLPATSSGTPARCSRICSPPRGARSSRPVVTGFVDDAIERLLDLDRLHEVPRRGRGARRRHGDSGAGAGDRTARLPDPAAVTRTDRTIRSSPRRTWHRPLDTPDAVRAWRSRGEPAPTATSPSPIVLAPLDPNAVQQPIEAVIVRRGSARRFSHAPIPLAALATVLHAAAAPVPLDAHAPSTCYLVANAVDDLASGAYVVGADGGLTLLREGQFRRDAAFLGLGQELPGDAAVALYWLVDLEAVFARLGDRGYRVAQLEAAIAGGRTYLAAYALGPGRHRAHVLR
jgi:hypothetical protein